LQILKEEVHDLLDLNPSSAEYGYMGGTMGAAFGAGIKGLGNGKPPIQIRETISGGIMLSGVTEVNVKSLEEMSACLERGSLCRATGSTNMNSQSRLAILTITLLKNEEVLSICEFLFCQLF
jgi:kinesin family protein 4/21/27